MIPPTCTTGKLRQLRDFAKKPVHQSSVHNQFSKLLRAYYADPVIIGLSVARMEHIKHSVVRTELFKFAHILGEFGRRRFGFDLNEGVFTGTKAVNS